MGRFFAVLLTLSLLLACAACGGKDAPSSQPPASGGGLVESQPESPPEPEETPQADDALVREMIFAYGAYEDTLNGPAALTVRKKSLFHRMESWGAGDLTPGDYLYWADTLPMTEEEQKIADQGQHHAQDHKGQSPFGYRFLPAA